MRLDAYLASKNIKFSRALLQRYIKEHGVRVNGHLVKKSHYQVSDIATIAPFSRALALFYEGECSAHAARRLERRSIQTLYEDGELVIPDKPAGVTAEQLTKGLYSVHRLDKDTSGVLVVAKNPRTQTALQDQWKSRSVKKTYCALVCGHLKYADGAIEAGIMRSHGDRRKMMLSASPYAKASTSVFHIEKYYVLPQLRGQFTLLRVMPLTGRTHQIRVHFSKIGHPVVGDDLYGNAIMNEKIEALCDLNRQFLHAKELSFVHPGTGKKMTIKAPLPPDLKKCLQSLKRAPK